MGIYQLAVDTIDGTIIYAVPDSYRIALPHLKTEVENSWFIGDLPEDFKLRSLGCYRYRRVDNKIARLEGEATAIQKLLNMKYWSVDQLYMRINGHRYRFANKLLLQGLTYELKVKEANEFLKRPTTDTEKYTMLVAEAIAKKLPVADVARSVLIAYEEQIDLLKKTEAMRITVTQAIVDASSEEEIQKALDLLHTEFHNRT